MAYNSGPVMSTAGTVGKNTIYAVYWLPPGYTLPRRYKTTIDTYLQDVAATSGKPTNVYATDQQYYGTGKRHIHYDVSYGGQITLTNAFPATGRCSANYATRPAGACITDKQIHTELTSHLTANPAQPKGLGAIYLVFLPEQVLTCFQASQPTTTECSSAAAHTTHPTYCGYHNFIGNGTATTVLYATMPFPTTKASCHTRPQQSPNNTITADTAISIVSHEQNETITDPLATAWHSSTTTAWEIADECAYVYGAPLGGTTGNEWNQTINGHPYYTQLEFSAEDYRTTGTRNGCIGAEELPTASVTGPSTLPTGLTTGFTASGHDPDSSTALTYAWSWGDGSSTPASTSATAYHSYGSAGSYTLTVTVTDADGWSATATKTVGVVGRPPSTGYWEVASD
ncbi:MAG: PKD domain-containing protein, partial [Acidimicrobiales bacterium]